MGSTRRSFTGEYKRDAVSLIVDGGHTIVEAAKKAPTQTPPRQRRARALAAIVERAEGSRLAEMLPPMA